MVRRSAAHGFSMYSYTTSVWMPVNIQTVYDAQPFHYFKILEINATADRSNAYCH